MSEIKDGGPAMICSKCRESFLPRQWQITSRDRRCLPCKRAQQNAKNGSDKEGSRARAKVRYANNRDYWRAYAEARRNDLAYKLKRSARRKVATEIEAGRLCRKPCESCGDDKTDAHHHDYAKPLDVIWLCRSCHIKHDKEAASAAA